MDRDHLKLAVAKAQAGEWDQSHKIVQEYSDTMACWIHAVLHKIEGDESNSRYWYARTDQKYENFTEADAELLAISRQLEGNE